MDVLIVAAWVLLLVAMVVWAVWAIRRAVDTRSGAVPADACKPPPPG